MITEERQILIEAVRVPRVRDNTGSLSTLGKSIRDEGMHRPLTLWKDGTLISGARRHRACLLAGVATVPAVFVDTVEDTAKNLLQDSQDDYLALPMKWVEVCRLWEILRRLDLPAAAVRMDEARRRGVELRRQTQTGARKAGRSSGHSEDYVLKLLSGPFGISETTAKRLWSIYGLATGIVPDATDEKRDHARQALAAIDSGESSISANYARLTSNRLAPISVPRPPTPPVSADAARQVAAWARSMPQMAGLSAGLVELGPPNTELTWDQVEPVYKQLMVVRRELEQIIKQMRESNKS